LLDQVRTLRILSGLPGVNLNQPSNVLLDHVAAPFPEVWSLSQFLGAWDISAPDESGVYASNQTKVAVPLSRSTSYST
jgi:hypothetical protein